MVEEVKKEDSFTCLSLIEISATPETSMSHPKIQHHSSKNTIYIYIDEGKKKCIPSGPAKMLPKSPA